MILNWNDMQSTVILITYLSQSMAPKRPAPKGPKLMHGYTLLIGPEAWLSTMRKRRMSSASTSVFYPLPYPQIRTSAFLPLSFCRILGACFCLPSSWMFLLCGCSNNPHNE